MRYALRGLLRSPGFAVVAIVSLALGIGANTAIFSLIRTLMLRPLPVEQPEQLVEFLNHYPGDPPLNFYSWASYEHFRDNNHVFSEITGLSHGRYSLRGNGLDPQIVEGEPVVGNFFEMLGVKPALGRLIEPSDDGSVAVLSWALWQSRFNLDRSILGKQIVLENVPVTIIGVTPREFTGLRVGAYSDIWIPSKVEDLIHPNSHQSMAALSLIARLRPDASLEKARAEMAVLFQWTLDERTRASKDPQMKEMTFDVQPAGTGLSTGLRQRFATPLQAMMAVVALLLAIACTNVAGMLLARGAGRQREMAVRLSLGASRWRLLRQALTEALLLSGIGGTLGVFVAWFGAAALLQVVRSGRPIIGLPPHIEIQVSPDAGVLLFAGVVALLTGVLFGLAPAWSAFHSAPATSLRDMGTSSNPRSRRVLTKSLVVAQVALSVGLLSTAGLFVGHLSTLERADLGFRRDHVLMMRLDPSRSGFTPAQLSQSYRELLRRLEAIPGVRSATISAPAPISGAAGSRFVNVQGHPERPEDRRYTLVHWVAPKYFETLGTPLLAGRDFAFEDQGQPRVAIINQAMAQYYFGNVSPIGQSFTFDGDNAAYQIVGVAGDAKYYEIREQTRRQVYVNTFQWTRPESEFAIRTGIPPEAAGSAVQSVVHDLLKDVPVVRVTSLADVVDGSIVPERLIATFSSLFGALGALLVATGIYGLLAYTVARRINEIGIRMALGATQDRVSRMILAEALTMTCGGLLLGVPIVYWGKRFAGRLIADLPVTSALPVIFGAAATIAVALLAAYLPARRAARVDPMEALRHE